LLDATIVLIRRPGRGESARILDARFGFDRLSALGYAVTLDDMELWELSRTLLNFAKRAQP
jgi:hypothetical protein